MNPLIESRWKPWFPHLAVIVWLLYLAITIWAHATLSQQPPLYDALGYFLKGKNFWDLLWQHHVFNPFVWPEYRPPGTILMSFPYGYDGFQAFHFRSVFFPIVLAAIAGWIVLRENAAKTEPAAIYVVLVLAVTSLPMFYELEPSSLGSHVTWGHVDPFFAAFAALAAAASLRSLHARSIGWLVVAAAIASFSIWIKPAGLAVMGAVAAVWFVAAGSRVLAAGADREARDRETRYLVRGTTLTILLYAVSIVGAVFGGYLSSEVIAYFTTAVKFIGSLGTPWSIEKAISYFQTTIGFPFGVLCVIGVGGAVAYAFRETPKKAWLDDPALIGIICGLGYLVLGLGWWIIATEGILVRYIFPFLLMFAVALLPSIKATAMRFGRIGYLLVLVIGLGSAANLAALLITQKPSEEWQLATGVNLSAGTWNSEVATARQFLAGKTRERSAPVIYAVDSYPGAYIFESEVVFAAVLNPNVAKVRFLRSIDWLRTSAYRFSDLLSADYLLVTPVRDVPLPNAGQALNSYQEEEDVMRAWVSTLSEADGVSVEINLPHMLLLKVADRSALSRATQSLTKRFAWRSETVAANQSAALQAEANQPDWWGAAAVASYARNLAAEEVAFGGIYRVHALAINRVGNGIKVEVWWEELRHEEANNQRYLFLHLLDSSGAIVHNQQIALDSYAPPSADRRWRYGAETFSDVLPNAKLASLGFGIYQPSVPGGGLIVADKGKRDWDNQRVIVKLP